MRDMADTTTSDLDVGGDIEYLDSLSCLRVEVDHGFESALKEMDSLQSELDGLQGEDLLVLCKENLVSTVVGQFGLASLLVDSRDGGAVTTTHNFDKGITSTAEDQTRYEAMHESRSLSGDEWKKHRRGAGYDNGSFNERKKQAYQDREVLRDGYTGRVLTKDGRTHLDHVVSAREIDIDARMNLHLSQRERVDLAKSEENLVFTSASINVSKNDHKMEEWLETTKRGEASPNHERYGIDKDKALEHDRAARKTINREVNVAAAKKYTTELMATGAKDAANMAYYTALGIVMKELSEGAVLAVKKAFAQREQGLGAMLAVFKEELAGTVDRLKVRWRDIAAGSIEAGITAFLSNIVVFLVNLFATTLKKIVTMIRAGFVSLVQALKILANPPQGMSNEEARFESSGSVIDSYKHAICPKPVDYLPSSVESDWPMYGAPEVIISDGGPGYASIASQAFVIEAGSESRIVESYAGWRKPFIERFFLTLRTKFAQTLRSYCGKYTDRPNLDATIQEKASMTLGQFRTALYEWLLDEYHHSPHGGLEGRTPYDVWQDQVFDWPPCVPTNFERIQLTKGETRTCTISGKHAHQGVRVNKLRYNDPDNRIKLIGMRLRQRGFEPEVTVQYTYNDISSVNVIDPETDEIIQAFVTDERIPIGMSYAEHEARGGRRYTAKGFTGNPRAKSSKTVLEANREHDAQMRSCASRKSSRAPTEKIHEVIRSMGDDGVNGDFEELEENWEASDPQPRPSISTDHDDEEDYEDD